MAAELSIDRVVVRRVIVDLEGSSETLVAVGGALPEFEPVSFGSSEVGGLAQSMAVRAADTIRATLADLDQIHRYLAETLAGLEREADLVDQEAADRVASLHSAVQSTAPGGSA